MYKKVNIYPQTPITNIRPPIRSVTKKVTRSEEDIRACIIARAKVEEILPDGSIIRLNLTNYNTNNYDKKPNKDDTIETPKEVNTNTSVGKPEDEPRQFTYNNRYGKNKKKNKYYQPSKITETVTKEESTESKSDVTAAEAIVSAKVADTEDVLVETIDVDTIV